MARLILFVIEVLIVYVLVLPLWPAAQIDSGSQMLLLAICIVFVFLAMVIFG